MLRACRRVLKPAGLMASFVILESDPSFASEPMRVGGVGGSEISTVADYVLLMEKAEFRSIRTVDVTHEYGVTIEAWLRESEAERGQLVDLLGVDDFEERQALRREGLAAVRRGTRSRFLISGTAGE